MAGWWSIEVFHGEFSAGRWQDTYSSALIESAISHGATNWEWHEHRWGVVFEAEFGTDAEWEAFRTLPLVQAALVACPPAGRGRALVQARWPCPSRALSQLSGWPVLRRPACPYPSKPGHCRRPGQRARPDSHDGFAS